MKSERKDQRALRLDWARRSALTSFKNAVIKPRAMIVLYRLNRRVERVVISPLLFAKVSSVPDWGCSMDGTPASSALDAVRHHDHHDRQRGPGRVRSVGHHDQGRQ